eukprot:gnl/TRDRNA2_/TRDRNA2_181557_c0_seq1.p1 gnl/TRDRNA2_/TRDRNA2_181557_c0~~gnl/TRDRNA2_/TRDRNA2_181557_c0_seq1.p1  ORF type:complete len:738 (+),score=159.98 gnl/TRDRNA2_/TRDRNA2_181557_c0_seq1:72-2285(+)
MQSPVSFCLLLIMARAAAFCTDGNCRNTVAYDDDEVGMLQTFLQRRLPSADVDRKELIQSMLSQIKSSATGADMDAELAKKIQELTLLLGDEQESAKQPAPVSPTMDLSVVDNNPSANAKDNAAASEQTNGRKVKLNMEIYYESRCPYSMMLIQDLNTVMGTDIAKYLKPDSGNVHWDLKMFPFGNGQTVQVSEVSEGYKFWHSEKSSHSHIFICQHGEEECLGNMIHMCYSRSKEASVFIPYFACMAEHADWSIEKASFDCMKASAKSEEDAMHNMHELKDCVLSDSANKQMAEIANKTNNLNPQRNYVPWVTVNGVHVSSVENGYMQRLLCTTILASGEVPSACNSIELVQTDNHVDALHQQPVAGLTGRSHSVAGAAGEQAQSITGETNTREVSKPVEQRAESAAETEKPTQSPAGGAKTAEEAKHYADEAAAKAAEAQAVAEKAKAALDAALKTEEGNKTKTKASTSTSHKEDDDAPLELELMYESQCPYSLMFLQDMAKILPAMYADDIKERLDLKLIPYGNAQSIPVKTISEGYKFWHSDLEKSGKEHVFLCQHGDSECLGNMIHMCAMQQQPDPAKYIPFLGCMAENPNYSVEKGSFECASKWSMDIEALKKCTQSSQASKDMQKLAEHTASRKDRKWVPWVDVNEVHAPSAENGYLQRLLCTVELGTTSTEEEKSNYPNACNQIELLQVKSEMHKAQAATPAPPVDDPFTYGMGEREVTRPSQSGVRVY